MTTPLFIKKLFHFYQDGFKNMTIGKTLWAIVLVKLFIMFAILKLFFFPNFLNTHFKDDVSKAKHVGTELVKKADKQN